MRIRSPLRALERVRLQIGCKRRVEFLDTLARLKPHTIVGMFVVLDGHGGRECAELVFKRLGYHVLVRAPHLRQHICLSFELTPIDSIALCNPTFAYASFLPNIQFRTPGRTTQLFVGSRHYREKQRADDGVRLKFTTP